MKTKYTVLLSSLTLAAASSLQASQQSIGERHRLITHGNGYATTSEATLETIYGQPASPAIINRHVRVASQRTALSKDPSSKATTHMKTASSPKTPFMKNRNS